MNANSELNDLSSAELDAVSGGWFCFFVPSVPKAATGEGGGQNDPAQQFQQIMQQLTQG